jgi:NitT/TauT family transport system permease protein
MAVGTRGDGSQPALETAALPVTQSRSYPAPGRVLAWLYTPIALIVGIGVWQLAITIFNVPNYLVPTPAHVWDALSEGMQSGVLVHHTAVTAREIVVGYAAGSLVGIVLGFLIAQYQMAERMIYPYVIALNAVPKVAIAPLLVVWFGVGLTSKVIIAATVSFFPLLVNVIVGLRSTDSDQLRLMRSLTASGWQTFYMVKIRNALPMVFAGLEVAIVLSVVGVIVGEFVAAQEGLGYYISEMNALVNTPGMFAALLILSIMGFVMSQIVKLIAHKVVFWKQMDNIIEGP